MQLTGVQIRLIKKSWEVFRKMDPAIIGDVFYSKLFLEYPALRKLFKPSMEEQYKKLIDMFSFIVSRLERIDEVTGDIQQMAIRHVAYGVKEKHYTTVGEALLYTLEKGLGNDWNEEIKQAWTTCYAILTTEIIAVAYPKKT